MNSMLGLSAPWIVDEACGPLKHTRPASKTRTFLFIAGYVSCYLKTANSTRKVILARLHFGTGLEAQPGRSAAAARLQTGAAIEFQKMPVYRAKDAPPGDLEPIRKPHLIVGRLKSHGRFVVLHRRIIEIRLLRTPCVTRDSLALGIESRFPERLLVGRADRVGGVSKTPRSVG